MMSATGFGSTLARRLAGVASSLLLAGLMTAAELPNPAIDVPAVGKQKQTAVLAGGCFWCTEAVFEHVDGVEKAVSGYAGGDKSTAHYEMVSSGKTGHAEVVQVTFDPAKITYGQLLKVFFSVAHDPTQLNRQGPDVGPQYRSAIFYANADQKRVAEAYIQQLEKAHAFKQPIVTEVTALKGFYEAEEHHQEFCRRNPNNGYVKAIAAPKVDKVKQQFPGMIKK